MESSNMCCALTLLLLLTVTSPSPVKTLRPADDLGGTAAAEAREEKPAETQTQEDEDLFEDVDPKKLAAVLLEALNQTQVQTRWDRAGFGNREEEKARRDGEGDEVPHSEVGSLGRSDRDRDGREELELLMAVRGKEQQQAEEEEKMKAQQEEEKMTEKVTSHTTSQTVQVQRELQPISSQQALSRPGPGGREEEEEQLNPEELRSLERMMKEFPRLNSPVKREGAPEASQRAPRGYTSYNEVVPDQKGSGLAMSKKKLKWQEETQKAVSFPTFRGGNFMDDFENINDDGDAAQSQLPAQPKEVQEEEPEEEEEELSPEEEEARAKAEQEEMRRQAAEVQKAKMEEEKLADIASDMLLRYMVKQSSNQKNGASASNAVEDKRSEEELVTAEDDIDPQTIDKLIEISSKLHLPADDVVDIISDVEKKKRKDVPLDSSFWQRPPSLQSSSSSATSQLSANRYNLPVARKPFRAVNLLKSWFQEKSPAQDNDFWSVEEMPLPPREHMWTVAQRPPKTFWSRYPNYFYTPSPYYPRQPYPFDRLFYHRPLTSRYPVSKPALADVSYLLNTKDRGYIFPPKRHFHSWIPPRLRKPPAYSIPMYPLGFRSRPMSNSLRSRTGFPPAPQLVSMSASVAPVTQGNPKVNLERIVKQLLLRRPQGTD